jgi:hypothetical protein
MKPDNSLLIAATIIVVVLAVLGSLLYVFLFNGERMQPAVEAPEQDVGEDRVEGLAIDQEIEKVLFFQSPNSFSQLMPVRRRIFNTISLTQQANQVVQALVAGPFSGEEAIATIPPGTRLLRCFVSPEGLATLVFSAEISDNHPGGTSAELITLNSIVDTLCVNFPNIRAVQIIISGKEDATTLAGHIDITWPLTLDPAWLPPLPRLQTTGEQPQEEGETQPAEVSGEDGGEDGQTGGHHAA